MIRRQQVALQERSCRGGERASRVEDPSSIPSNHVTSQVQWQVTNSSSGEVHTERDLGFVG